VQSSALGEGKPYELSSCAQGTDFQGNRVKKFMLRSARENNGIWENSNEEEAGRQLWYEQNSRAASSLIERGRKEMDKETYSETHFIGLCCPVFS
jgi:hypothetical protein